MKFKKIVLVFLCHTRFDSLFLQIPLAVYFKEIFTGFIYAECSNVFHLLIKWMMFLMNSVYRQHNFRATCGPAELLKKKTSPKFEFWKLESFSLPVSIEQKIVYTFDDSISIKMDHLLLCWHNLGEIIWIWLCVHCAVQYFGPEFNHKEGDKHSVSSLFPWCSKKSHTVLPTVDPRSVKYEPYLTSLSFSNSKNTNIKCPKNNKEWWYVLRYKIKASNISVYPSNCSSW